MATFSELLCQHVGASYAKQLSLLDHIGDRPWGVTISEGVVKFGDDLRYPMQLLGTEADGNETWLWAWGNEQSNLLPAVLRSCHALREMGEREGIPELKERSFSLDVANGHTIALVASGIDGKCCYFRGPYDGGALFFLVKDVPATLLAPVRTERAMTVLGEIISRFEVDHRPMAESFFKSQGFSLESSSNTLVATRGNDEVKLTFDKEGRIVDMGAKVQGSAPAVKKPWWQFWK